jgi:hypothetical protein
MDRFYQTTHMEDIYPAIETENPYPYPYIDTSFQNILPYVTTSRLPLHDIPNLLYYKLYPNDPLWYEDFGLLTRREIAGVPLDRSFFRETIKLHLSFPVDKPWFFSPYISVTASFENVSKFHANPHGRHKPWFFEPAVDEALLASMPTWEQRGEVDGEHQVAVMGLRQRGRWGEIFVYSVRELVGVLELEREVYEHRPDWWGEFLVLRYVPRDMISVYEKDQFERGKWSGLVGRC